MFDATVQSPQLHSGRFDRWKSSSCWIGVGGVGERRLFFCFPWLCGSDFPRCRIDFPHRENYLAFKWKKQRFRGDFPIGNRKSNE